MKTFEKPDSLPRAQTQPEAANTGSATVALLCKETETLSPLTDFQGEINKGGQTSGEG